MTRETSVGESPEKVDGNPEKHDSKKMKEKDEAITNTIPFYKLFSFADSLDYLLMLVGTVGAVANGIAMPLMTILMGNVIDAFGKSADTKVIVHEVSKVQYPQ